MLTLALVATVAGFILLVVGLVTGIVWLAIACIVVCVLGLLLLLVDVLGWGRRDDDTPKFTIRKPEETGVPAPESRIDEPGAGAAAAARTGAAAGAASAATSDGPPQAWSAVPEGHHPTEQPPTAPQTPVGEPPTSPAPLAADAPQPDVPAAGGGVPEGGVTDYVRSVTGPIDLAALARRRAEAAVEAPEDSSSAGSGQPQDEHTGSAQPDQDRQV